MMKINRINELSNNFTESKLLSSLIHLFVNRILMINSNRSLIDWNSLFYFFHKKKSFIRYVGKHTSKAINVYSLDEMYVFDRIYNVNEYLIFSN